MLWFSKRRHAPPATAVADRILAAELPLALDAALFKHHCGKLLETAAQDGSIENWLAAQLDGFVNSGNGEPCDPFRCSLNQWT